MVYDKSVKMKSPCPGSDRIRGDLKIRYVYRFISILRNIGVIEAIAQEIVLAEFIALRAPVAHSEHGDHLHRH